MSVAVQDGIRASYRRTIILGGRMLQSLRDTATVPQRILIRVENEKGPASANPLIYLVGRARFELATNGLTESQARGKLSIFNDL
ncbi:MAG: hypothetical protein ACKO4M_01725 [Betaproteobacteria bacterium]